MKLSKAFGMGRGDDHIEPVFNGVIRVGRVRLLACLCDNGGAYWGAGAPLWRALTSEGDQRFFRAYSKETVIENLREQFPSAKIW